jgi:hypothetical protein
VLICDFACLKLQVSVYCWDRPATAPLLRLQFSEQVLELHIQDDRLAVLSQGVGEHCVAVLLRPSLCIHKWAV